MRQVYTEIEINAPAETVWEILTDLEKYREWNPFIRESAGKAVLGCGLTCRPQFSGGPIMTFHPVVSRVEPYRIFAWKGHVLFPGLADGEHIFEIEPLGKNRVRHIHRQEFRGLLIPLVWRRMYKRTAQGFISMNKALKKRAEQASK